MIPGARRASSPRRRAAGAMAPRSARGADRRRRRGARGDLLGAGRARAGSLASGLIRRRRVPAVRTGGALLVGGRAPGGADEGAGFAGPPSRAPRGVRGRAEAAAHARRASPIRRSTALGGDRLSRDARRPGDARRRWRAVVIPCPAGALLSRRGPAGAMGPDRTRSADGGQGRGRSGDLFGACCAFARRKAARLIRRPRVRAVRARGTTPIGGGRSGRRHEAAGGAGAPDGARGSVGGRAEGTARAPGAGPVGAARGDAAHVGPCPARRPRDAGRVRVSVVIPRPGGAARAARVGRRRSAVAVREARLVGEARVGREAPVLRAAPFESARPREDEKDRRRRRPNARAPFLHDRILVASRRPQTSLSGASQIGRAEEYALN